MGAVLSRRNGITWGKEGGRLMGCIGKFLQWFTVAVTSVFANIVCTTEQALSSRRRLSPVCVCLAVDWGAPLMLAFFLLLIAMQ